MSRFFFALWPDDATRHAIKQCRSHLDYRGRAVNQENLHITLLFIGKMTVNQQQNIIQQTQAISWPEFTITIDHSGYFNRSRVFWLGMKTVPEPLQELHQQLSNIALDCHLTIKKQNYTPHITLSRKTAPVASQSIQPIVWPINRFVLLESIDTPNGVQYKKVKCFTCNK